MKVIERIKIHEVLKNFIEPTCCENEVCVSISEDISPESYVIIKVDKYYNSLRVKKRPASVDCLIIRKCQRSGFGITLVELKKIKKGEGFEIENVKNKFENTINDFILKKFREVLNLDFKDFKLYFVTHQEIYKRDIGLKLEYLMSLRFTYQNKHLMIAPRMPNPTLQKCY